jgi:rSAM/selenodomain-associated transferase 2
VKLAIVIPVLNEAAEIETLLAPMQALRRRGHEIILADGGSDDGTPARAEPLVDRVVQSPPGRARQMNAGAAVATRDILFFLHADSRLPDDFALRIADALQQRQQRWGRFDIRLAGDRFMFRVVEWFMNQRSRRTGISTGDQGLFVERALFETMGGFPAIPLMEDIAITDRLRKIEPPICLSARIVTSTRRWEKNGVWRTIWLMWRLRFAYWRGADPADLARIYYPQSVHG